MAHDHPSRSSPHPAPLTGAGRDGFIVIALMAMIVVVATGATWIGVSVLVAASLVLATTRWVLNRRR